MKKPTLIGALALCGALVVLAQNSMPPGAPSFRPRIAGAVTNQLAALITDVSPDHRRVQQVSLQTNFNGTVTPRTNAYVEVATGMYYQKNGEWKESREEIDLLPDGLGAVALQGGHKVVFASDINTDWAIDMETPDGKRLRSHVLGLGYYDVASDRAVIIAMVQSSIGLLVETNQILYTNAFSGVQADVRYTYRKSGFEQDVILRTQPPSPAEWDMDPATTRLEVFTEFLNPPTPIKTETAVSGTTLIDESLDFGATLIGAGRAFAVGQENGTEGIPVAKQWVKLDGRDILIEDVAVADVTRELNALPQGASLKKTSKNARLAKLNRSLPGRTKAAGKGGKMLLAKLSEPQPGLVLDYVTTTTYLTNYTFYADTTYYISGSALLRGTTTFEGGAVIKYAANKALYIYPPGIAQFSATADRPVIFTAKDDDSVGETITDSTGIPVGYYANPALDLKTANNPALQYVRIAHAQQAITLGSALALNLSHAQFVNCNYGVAAGYYQSLNVNLKNVLFSHVQTPFDLYTLSGGATIKAQNVTFDSSANLVRLGTPTYQNLYLTNCILANVTNFGWSGYPAQHLSGCYNGFYNSPITFGTPFYTSSVTPFQTLGQDYYLASNSSFRNMGTTAINAQLLTDIGGMTTYAPPTSTPDSNPPDLGFHYPVSRDWDLDDMEDGWEYQNFGNLAQTHDGDFDDDGYSNWEEYLYETDPNTVLFTVQFDNLRVNANTANGTYLVFKGVPDKMAVLMDNTNFASATWIPYTTSLSVNVGSTDGPHQVWIGLKGRATTSEGSWGEWPLTRDTAPPVITITNPIVTTVSRPILQLQGYSPEPLSSLYYDVTNAAGSLTNVQGYVNKQWFDTNLFELTTNWFECVDIQLTNGNNIIALRATDVAGNVTTNVYSYVLDYSGDTTAPVLTVYWPQDGTQISGNSFTFRGWLDDSTANVTAQIVDASDVTNAVSGLLERDGLLWVEDLPLGSGTNTLTLTMTDAAGNVSVTNLTVIHSDVLLTVNDVPESQLNQARVTVSGTINVSDRKIWVNGMEVTNVSDGIWFVEGVPLNEGGTAVIQARAISNTDNNGNGTGGNGGSSSSMAVSGNPTSDTAVDENPQVNKPTEIVTIHYHKNWKYLHITLWIGGYPLTADETEQIQWDAGKPGSWTWDECFGDTFGDDYYYIWGDGYWGANGVGTQTGNLDRGHRGEVCGVKVPDLVAPYTAPSWPGEYCKGRAIRVWYLGDLGVLQTAVVSRDAQTLYELHTGGKKGTGSKKLFVLTAGAVGQANFFYPEKAAPVTYPIANTAIALGDLGKLGSDGRLYKVLGDGETHDVTPKVVGSKYYTFSQPGVSKHRLWIMVNGTCPLQQDRVVTCAKYCVGQRLDFTPMWTPEVPGIASKTVQWEFGGNFVNDSSQHSTISQSEPPTIEYYGSVNYFKNPALLTQESTHAWWVSGKYVPSEEYHAHIGENLTFDNGQQVVVTTIGKFNMFRPKPVNYTLTNTFRIKVRHGHVYGSDPGLGDKLGAYDPPEYYVSVDSTFDGDAAITQLINGYATNECPFVFSTGGSNQLDLAEFPQIQGWKFQTPVTALAPTDSMLHFGDGQNLECVGKTAEGLEFVDYIRFKPVGEESIYVTIGKVNWGLEGSTDYSLVTGSLYDYRGFTYCTSVGCVYPPPQGSQHIDSQVSGSEEFPQWDAVATGTPLINCPGWNP